MPPVVLAISGVFALVMVLLLLREIRTNRTRMRNRAEERPRRDATARRVTDHWRGEG